MKNKSFKEIWKNPKSKALIKLGIWGIFFLMLFALAAFGEDNNHSKKPYNDEQVSYLSMKKDLLESNLLININITNNDNVIIIDGKFIDNKIEGTIESKEEINKFRIKDNKLYNLNLNEEVINDSFFEQYKKHYLIPELLFEFLENEDYLKQVSEENINYSYTIKDNISITVYTNKQVIEKIIILDEDTTFEIGYLIIN